MRIKQAILSAIEKDGKEVSVENIREYKERLAMKLWPESKDWASARPRFSTLENNGESWKEYERKINVICEELGCDANFLIMYNNEGN